MPAKSKRQLQAKVAAAARFGAQHCAEAPDVQAAAPAAAAAGAPECPPALKEVSSVPIVVESGEVVEVVDSSSEDSQSSSGGEEDFDFRELDEGKAEDAIGRLLEAAKTATFLPVRKSDSVRKAKDRAFEKRLRLKEAAVGSADIRTFFSSKSSGVSDGAQASSASLSSGPVHEKEDLRGLESEDDVEDKGKEHGLSEHLDDHSEELASPSESDADDFSPEEQEPTFSEAERAQWNKAVEKIDSLGLKSANKKREASLAAEGISRHDVVLLLAVRLSVSRVLNGWPIARACRFAFSTIFMDDLARTKRTSQSRTIHRLVNFYVQNLALPMSERGRHPKSICLIDDEEYAQQLRDFIDSLRPHQRSVERLRSYVNSDSNTTVYGAQSISPRTAQRWMLRLGYQQKTPGSGIYTDGHEKEDVIEYRTAFVQRMEDRWRRMDCFETGVQHRLEAGEKPLVLVTHDETVAYSNETRKKVWVQAHKHAMGKKSLGRSLMTSGFACPCHGFWSELLANDKGWAGSSPVSIINAQNDGYWTNTDLVTQLRDCTISFFEHLHPGAQGLFLFDNSGNHHARAPNGLDASVLNLGDGGAKNRTIVRNGYHVFANDRVKIRISQPMTFVAEDGTVLQKGIKRILMERDLWNDALRLESARELLAAQPDFAAQREWTRETVEDRGHLVDFYPRYHCELNFIERVWSWFKQELRKRCDFTFDGLRRNVPAVLNQVPPAFVRKFAEHAVRYMRCYQMQRDGRNLPPAMVHFAMKKYKSHREVSENLFRDWEQEWNSTSSTTGASTSTSVSPAAAPATAAV